jgi:hypothetical protein
MVRLPVTEHEVALDLVTLLETKMGLVACADDHHDAASGVGSSSKTFS